MGQRVGKLPESTEGLMDELWRVLRWSAEVLARADDNVDAEDSFLVEFDDARIAAKVNKWLDAERSRAAAVNPAAFRPDREARLHKAFIQLFNDINHKMRKDYEKAYEDMKRFTQLVDDLAEEQRKIHKKLLELAEFSSINSKKIYRKFGSLRVKVFKNLRASEKMLFQDKKLKNQFIKKVSEIDRENMELCKWKVKKIIEDY